MTCLCGHAKLCSRVLKEAVLLQVMRHDVSLALGKTGPNVDVMCTDKRFGGRFLTFEQVRLPRCMRNASPFYTLTAPLQFF